MFASRDEGLQARVRELESQVERLTGLLDGLLAGGDRSAGVTGVAAEAVGVGQQRFVLELNRVYHATSFGHVAVYFVGGRTGRVRLLVGQSDPPATSVGHADASSSVGGIVRPGEYWMVATRRPGVKAGFEGVFTPLS